MRLSELSSPHEVEDLKLPDRSRTLRFLQNVIGRALPFIDPVAASTRSISREHQKDHIEYVEHRHHASGRVSHHRKRASLIRSAEGRQYAFTDRPLPKEALQANIVLLTPEPESSATEVEPQTHIPDSTNPSEE